MKIRLSKFLPVLVLLLITLFLGVSCGGDDQPDDPNYNIDLKADTINFSVVPTTQFAGTATIQGVVKNVGDNYVSDQGQQLILLYERQLGTPTSQLGNLVAQTAFINLNAGESLTLSYSRSWNSSSPSEGEFAPEYILVISYDPDIGLDGNKQNDDNNTANDKIVVSGAAINDLF